MRLKPKLKQLSNKALWIVSRQKPAALTAGFFVHQKARTREYEPQKRKSAKGNANRKKRFMRTQ
jgi:hypothetical protein